MPNIVDKEGTVGKEATSHYDIYDAFRLAVKSVKFYHFGTNSIS